MKALLTFGPKWTAPSMILTLDSVVSTWDNMVSILYPNISKKRKEKKKQVSEFT